MTNKVVSFRWEGWGCSHFLPRSDLLLVNLLFPVFLSLTSAPSLPVAKITCRDMTITPCDRARTLFNRLAGPCLDPSLSHLSNTSCVFSRSTTGCLLSVAACKGNLQSLVPNYRDAQNLKYFYSLSTNTALSARRKPWSVTKSCGKQQDINVQSADIKAF